VTGQHEEEKNQSFFSFFPLPDAVTGLLEDLRPLLSLFPSCFNGRERANEDAISPPFSPSVLLREYGQQLMNKIDRPLLFSTPPLYGDLLSPPDQVATPPSQSKDKKRFLPHLSPSTGMAAVSQAPSPPVFPPLVTLVGQTLFLVTSGSDCRTVSGLDAQGPCACAFSPPFFLLTGPRALFHGEHRDIRTLTRRYRQCFFPLYSLQFLGHACSGEEVSFPPFPSPTNTVEMGLCPPFLFRHSKEYENWSYIYFSPSSHGRRMAMEVSPATGKAPLRRAG